MVQVFQFRIFPTIDTVLLRSVSLRHFGRERAHTVFDTLITRSRQLSSIVECRTMHLSSEKSNWNRQDAHRKTTKIRSRTIHLITTPRIPAQRSNTTIPNLMLLQVSDSNSIPSPRKRSQLPPGAQRYIPKPRRRRPITIRLHRRRMSVLMPWILNGEFGGC